MDVDTGEPHARGVDGLSIEDVVVKSGGDEYSAIIIRSSTDVSMVKTNASGASHGVDFVDAQNVRIENGTFGGEGAGVNIWDTENVRLADSTLLNRVEAINSESVDIVDNDAATDRVIVRGSRDALVANDTLEGVDITFAYTGEGPEQIAIRNNVLAIESRPYWPPGFRPTLVTVSKDIDASQVELHGNVLDTAATASETRVRATSTPGGTTGDTPRGRPVPAGRSCCGTR